MKRHPKDTDLDFLLSCSNEELEFLVRLIIEVGGKSNSLVDSTNFKLYHGDHKKYAEEIIAELQAYGGHTMCNAVRGYGIPYREALIDVLEKLKVTVDKREELEGLEEKLLSWGLKEFLKRLSDDAKKSFVEVLCNVEKGVQCGWKASAVDRNAMAAKSVFAGLPTAATLLQIMASVGATFPTASPVVTVPTVAFGGLFSFLMLGPSLATSAFFLGTPAMRVMVPAVIYIAFLRKVREVHKR